VTDSVPTDALRSAVGALKLRDIILYAARFGRPSQIAADADGVLRGKRTIQFTRNDKTAEQPESLQIAIGLGVRITGLDQDGSEPPVFIEIEADFLADYEITSDISEESIKAFASFNAVHNVWPFWRQHVFDVVQRARLDPIEIPLFSG
jgi:hypothetical protein